MSRIKSVEVRYMAMCWFHFGVIVNPFLKLPTSANLQRW